MSSVDVPGQRAAVRRLLGRWLRAKRGSLRPADLGLPCGPRGRSPSLTHFQVARLAGISARSYQDVEAGHRAPGRWVLERIVAALPLSDAEVAYLHRLARAATCHTRAQAPVGHPDTARAAALVVDRYTGAGFATDHRYRIVAANDPVHRCVPGLLRDGNLLNWLFGSPEATRVLPDWETEATGLLSAVRAAQARHPHGIGWYETTMAGIAASHADAGRLWRESLLRICDPPPVSTIRIRRGGRVSELTLTRLQGPDDGLTVVLVG